MYSYSYGTLHHRHRARGNESGALITCDMDLCLKSQRGRSSKAADGAPSVATRIERQLRAFKEQRARKGKFIPAVEMTLNGKNLLV